MTESMDAVRTDKSKLLEKKLSEESLLAFTKHPYYVERWRGIIDGSGGSAGFNIFAAIFGVAWCFYRKLFKLGVALLFASILVELVSCVVAITLFGVSVHNIQALEMIGFLATLLCVNVPLGFKANRIYFQNTG